MASTFDLMMQDAGPVSGGQSVFDQMRADAANAVPVRIVPPPERPNGFVKGLNDVSSAGAQLLTHVLPDGVVNAVNKATQYVNNLPYIGPVTQALGMTPATASDLDKQITQTGQDYDAQLRASGHTGIDWTRAAGQAVGSAPLAAVMPAGAATTGARILSGAASGAAGALTQPVESEGDYFTKKGVQLGVGAVTGGVMSPVLGKIVDGVVQKAGSFMANRQANQIDLAKLDATLRQVAQDTGQRWEDMGPKVQAELRSQVMDSLSQNKAIDPAAAARKADFTAAGIEPTLGQITRDAGQFAKERNLRTMPGVGDPLLQRFQQQGRQLSAGIGSYANGAQDTYNSGRALADALSKTDEGMSKAVSSAYSAARASTGKDAELPLQGLAQDYAGVLDSFGDKVPSGVRNQFNKFGLDPANPQNLRKLFTVEEADKLLKVINANQSNDPATNNALSQLRTAVKNSVTPDGTEDVFAGARKAAAARFTLHDAVPALQAAATGSTAPDDFVKRFLIGGKTEEVQKLAKLLTLSNPDAAQQARAQIGQHLQTAAFGENAAGDKAFRPEMYAKALRQFGDDKLGAFFSPDEVSQMHRLSRVGAYIESIPNAAPVNHSNNWGAITGLASKIPGVGAITGLAKGAKNVIDNQTGVSRALAAKVPVTPTQLKPEEIRLLSRLLTVGSGASGIAAAGVVK